MTDHNHTTRVPGCFRCELTLDELPDPEAALEPTTTPPEETP